MTHDLKLFLTHFGRFIICNVKLKVGSQIDAKLPTKISLKVLADFHSLADPYQRISPHYLIFMSDVTYIGGFLKGKWE